MNVGTSLCLFDPLEDYTRKVSATASTTVQSCKRSGYYRFTFDSINSNSSIRKNCSIYTNGDLEDDIKKKEDAQYRMEQINQKSKII